MGGNSASIAMSDVRATRFGKSMGTSLAIVSRVRGKRRAYLMRAVVGEESERWRRRMRVKAKRLRGMVSWQKSKKNVIT